MPAAKYACRIPLDWIRLTISRLQELRISCLARLGAARLGEYCAGGIVRHPSRLDEWSRTLFRRDDLDRERGGNSHLVEQADESNEVEGALARQTPLHRIFEQISAVISVGVIELDDHDSMRRNLKQLSGVRGATKIMPRIDQHAAVRAVGEARNSPGSRGVGNRGPRQKFERDLQTVSVGTIAQCREALGRDLKVWQSAR